MNAFYQDIAAQLINAQICLPLFRDLHAEVERSWAKSYSAHIHCTQANHADVEGMRDYGYASMSPTEETLATYFSVGEMPTLKSLSLLTKPLHVTSHINGRAYAAVGQAGVPTD